MARPKGWFPVGHGFLDDPEVDELYDRFGYGGVRLWLKILSLSDQKENNIKVDPYLIKKLSGVSRQRLSSTWLTLNWMLTKGWLTASQHLTNGQEEASNDLPNTFVGCFSLPKYAEYHRTRLPNQNLNGAKLAPNSIAPNLPNLPNLPKKEKNHKNDSKRKCVLPSDFELTERRRDLAEAYWKSKGVSRDVVVNFDKFVSHHKSHGTLSLSWDDSWRTWYVNAVEMGKTPTEKQKPRLVL